MKLKLALIALIAGASMIAQAQTTRAEVKAETKEAVKAGTIKEGEAGDMGAKTKSTASRADVKASTRAAAMSGDIKAGEAGAEATMKPKSTKKRADVKAETAAANKAGALKGGEAAK